MSHILMAVAFSNCLSIAHTTHTIGRKAKMNIYDEKTIISPIILICKNYKANLLFYHFGAFDERYYELVRNIEKTKERISEKEGKKQLNENMLDKVFENIKDVSYFAAKGSIYFLMPSRRRRASIDGSPPRKVRYSSIGLALPPFSRIFLR